MQTVESVFAAANLPSEAAPEFTLVIVYEDFANGRCAIKFYEWIVAEFGELFTFVTRFLRFKELLCPRLGERWACEVAEADMVVIAAHEDAGLPSVIKDWFRTWGKPKWRNQAALVALLSASQDNTTIQTPVRSCLQQVARRAGMKFVCQQIDRPKKERAFPAEIIQRNAHGSLALYGPAIAQRGPNAGGKHGRHRRRQGVIEQVGGRAILRPGMVFGGHVPVSPPVD